MIASMTGFGRGEAERDGRVLTVEVRSVNHRFLELSLRLPRGLQPLENKLRSHLQGRMDRGKVNLTVSWKGAGENGGELSVDMELAGQYSRILQEIRESFGFRDPVTLGQLVALPDILKWTEPELSPEESWSLMIQAVDQAIDDLLDMRRVEGEALRDELITRVAAIRTALAAVESRAPERVKQAKERLRTRVGELLEGEAEVDNERLLVEAAFQAERMDCTEECVRLRSHVDQFETLINGDEPVGRKLNFLSQEMNREANTIGSKANDVEIAREVIGLKEEIEIVREQIQNIE